jgi:hypothetical protein
VTHLAGGLTRESLPNGGSLNRDRGGRPLEYHNTQTNTHANFDRNGRVAQINRVTATGAHMNIQRGPGNVRRIESVRTVHGGVERMVSYGHNRGFYEHPIEGRPGYMQRTVVVNGRVYAGVYRHYYYHGIYLNSPVPAVVYAPAYYGWLLSPWPARFAYSPVYWGWAGQPWYGYYSPYFTPYPTYAGPEQWLTDYVIAGSLQQSYDDQQQAQNEQDASAPPPPPITDEEKALMAQDIRNELARQKAAASSNAFANDNQAPQGNPPNGETAATEMPEALQDHLFTVYAAPIEAKLSTGDSCHLTEGDMLYRQSDAPDADNSIDVIVKGSHADTSHPDFCARSTQVKVQIADLQDMYIHKHELLAEGMQKQADLVGKKHGIPSGPKANPSKVPAGQATPDDQVVAELKKQIMEGDDAEKEVSNTSPPVS